MSNGVNKVILIGRLGADPEVKVIGEGTSVCTLSVATSESWKDKATGEKKEFTEWHRVVVWRGLAEICGKYLKKGDMAYFEGTLKTRKWQDKDGNDRYSTEVQARDMQMLGGGKGGGGQQSSGDPGPQADPYAKSSFDDDVPF